MQKIRLYRFDDNIVAYSLFILAFLTFTVVSSYDAVGAVDLPISGMIIYGILLFVALLTTRIRGDVYLPVVPVILLLLRCVFFMVGCAIVGESLSRIVYETGLTLLCLYLFIYMYNFRSAEFTEIKLLLGIFGVITTAQIALGIILNGSDKTVIAAGIGQSNYAAAFLVLGAVYFLFAAKNKTDYCFFAVCTIGIFMTQSFGAIVSVCGMIALWAFFKFNWKLPRTWFVLLVLILLGGLGAFLFSKTTIGGPIIDKIVTKFELLLEGDISGFGSSRLALYEFSWENIKEHWVFGAINNATSIVNESNIRWQNARTHNFFLELLLNYGAVGALLHMSLAIYIFKRAKKVGAYKNTNARAICFTLLGALLHGMVEPNFFTMHFEVFVWTLLGAYLSPNWCEQDIAGRAKQSKAATTTPDKQTGYSSQEVA